MFTARSEFRLTLRADNADLRLTQKGYYVGCVGQERYERFASFKRAFDELAAHLKSIEDSVFNWKQKVSCLPMQSDNPSKKSIYAMLRIADIDLKQFDAFLNTKCKQLLLENPSLAERLKIQSTYEDSEARQLEEIDEIKRNESIRLPIDFDYKQLNLSNEMKEKLLTYRPTSLGQASRIPGVTPAAIFRLFAHFKQQQQQQNTSSSSQSIQN